MFSMLNTHINKLLGSDRVSFAAQIVLLHLECIVFVFVYNVTHSNRMLCNTTYVNNNVLCFYSATLE